MNKNNKLQFTFIFWSQNIWHVNGTSLIFIYRKFPTKIEIIHSLKVTYDRIWTDALIKIFKFTGLVKNIAQTRTQVSITPSQ